ncbi:MAG: hypothetical protein EKK40_01240 [Bradyrhizobiaceae bacterium]|nr:MAG: hypothetical protein EKK40_01240 [Bradyrhizobiaceae bacterium]
MSRTPVHIVCSPRPGVGKTLVSRLLAEFLLLRRGSIAAFDISIREPSLVDYLPEFTETAAISDTHGQMALMDRLIVNDGAPKVVDLGFHVFDEFFEIIEHIGFAKEAIRRGVDPVIMFIPDRSRNAMMGWRMLNSRFPEARLVAIDNDQVLQGVLPTGFEKATFLKIPALPPFLKSIIARTNLSFTEYLRTNQDSSSELHQWIRGNYIQFRDMDELFQPTQRGPRR